MYKGLSFLNGVIIATMIFINGFLSNYLDPYTSTLVFHLVGLVFILFIGILKKNDFRKLKSIRYFYLLPGILGVLVIVLNNIIVLNVGITMFTAVSMFAQLLVSNLIDHFGLLGMPVNKFKKEKFIGLGISLLGILAMILI